jgi:hypothetical protein
LQNALQGHRAGDQVEVIFFRGPEKHTVSMELSRRSLPTIKFDLQELVSTVRQNNAKVREQLTQIFEGVTEEQASMRPEESEWSAREVLAHLIHVERDQQNNLAEMLSAEERWSDGYTGNLNAHIVATTAVYTTVAALLEQLYRTQAETEAFLQNLPENFVWRKSTFWRLAFGFASGPLHEETHYPQLEAALKAAGAIERKRV